MKKAKNYVALPDGNETCAYICTAYSKKQMRAARMNMRLNWQPSKKENLPRYLTTIGYPLKNWSDVTQFRY